MTRAKVPTCRKYSRQDQQALAMWAADCAQRVLPFFETVFPKDNRPRDAIKACRAWVRTGVFRMADIRGASLAAHAAARKAKAKSAACLAARAAGQAVATAHVPQHAYGSAYYALKAIAAAEPAAAEIRLAREQRRQLRRLPEHLRDEVRNRLRVDVSRKGIAIRLRKGRGF